MKNLDVYCRKIKKQYPKTMSKEQFYQVAHISKATALYLLQSGLVPCENTGKQTRNYTIQTADVIAYLYDRELHPELYKASDGWYAGTGGRRSKTGRKPAVRRIDHAKLEAYFTEQMKELPDLITIAQLCTFTGYSQKTAVKWCNTGKLKHFNISGRYLIPKECVARTMASPWMCAKSHKSPTHQAFLDDFRKQKNK